jgi:GT2 family glycosyltransferase
LQLLDEDPMTADGIGDCYHLSGLAWRSGHKCRLAELNLSPRTILSPCGAAAFFRKADFDSVNGFDEDFFCYAEDVDLGFRLRLAGHQAVVVPNAIVHHVGSATSGGKHSNFSIYHGHRNLVWTFVKNMPSVLFWPLLPLHIALNIVTIIYFSAKGKGKVIVKSKIDALIGLPSAWKKRQLIQKKRKASAYAIWKSLNKDFWK